jgi:multiple sugar transport system ATP-binding protein
MAKVSVQHVSKIHAPGKGGKASAIQDFNLEVDDRELVVLAGPAGCGKSAMLRMIAGLEHASNGDIRIGGKRVNDEPPRDRDIAMVFPNDALYPRMSVRANLAYDLKLRKFPDAEINKRVTEAAAILGIQGWLDRKPGALSACERQRAAVARAVVRQPKVFLFDEPLANFDAGVRAQLRAELIKLHQNLQATMIYATRDQADAMAMADRIVVMNQGVIQQTGIPGALYREPDNLFVAGFLGRPPMNLLRGKLRESGDALIFKEGEGGVIELKLPPRAEARAFAGREVIAGIRPEDIVIATDLQGAQRPATQRFQCLVDLAEPMGAEANVHLQTGAHTLVCRTGTPIGNDEAGHRMRFDIDPARVHFFDPETARRLPF